MAVEDVKTEVAHLRLNIIVSIPYRHSKPWDAGGVSALAKKERNPLLSPGQSLEVITAHLDDPVAVVTG